MDVTCITPTCEGREPFLALCRRYVDRFTLKPKDHLMEKSDNFHANLSVLLRKVRTEYVAFIEDDDWYHPDYLGDMLDRLEFSERLMIGYDPTVYYHLRHRGYMPLPHCGRASLYTTMGVASFIELTLRRPLADERPVDLSLWSLGRGSGVTTVGRLALGMKHGFTRTEGRGHLQPKEAWRPDVDGTMLKKYIGEDDYMDYSRLVSQYGEKNI